MLVFIASLFVSSPVFASSPQYFYNKLVFPSGNRPSGVAIADVNGDGREDLIVSNSTDNSVSIFLGQMDGTFGSKTDFAAGLAPGYVKAGDFNGDGKMDIVVVNECFGGCTGGLSILLGNGDGTFKSAVEYPTGPNPYSLAVGDFDGDGTLDLAVTSACSPPCSGFVSIYLEKEMERFKPEWTIQLPHRQMN